MARRVLLVDDEPSVLSGIQRRLGGELQLTLATSGEEALRWMDEPPPFAVVVTDMRMPRMTGLQLIQAARRKSPDTVFIMLTGNQDQATAIHALNDGQVFRFLTKPCPSSNLKKAIEAGLHQYELITSEKELLQKTFVGAVNLLTDFLELVQPGVFGRWEGVEAANALLQNGLHLESHWEYKLSARLAMLGFALLPEPQRTQFELAAEMGDELRESISRAAGVGRRIIERIPRLDTVACIIGMCGEVDGSTLIAQPANEVEIAITGATLLRVAIEWDTLMRQGLTPREAILELTRALPNVAPAVVNLLALSRPLEASQVGIELDVGDLEEGMVLTDDVLTNDGLMFLRSGRRLGWAVIEKLRSYKASGAVLPPVRVRLAASDAEQQSVPTATAERAFSPRG